MAAAVSRDHVGHAVDPCHGRAHQLDAARLQLRQLRRIGLERAIEEKSDRAPVGQHQGMVHGQGAGGQYADGALLQFIAVAVRAVKDAAAPALGQAVDGRQFVDHAGGQHEAAAVHDMAIRQGHAEAIAIAAGGRLHGHAIQPGDGGIRHQLRLALGRDGGRAAAVLGQETVGMAGVAVAALAAVDHQHAAAGARQLRGGGQARVAAADDDGIERDARRFRNVHAVLLCVWRIVG
ncbi:hypothetical protein D3C81_1447180 [compost metagenome]